ncbi:MAG: tetratricopeptide repeat protein [Nitrospirae bacterium]|nr:tetratricopeptide repeat protein [Nitrospirota bacterium]MCL5977018.1 tetratricopeptide repeat protein [Nitrospirota bacterium]
MSLLADLLSKIKPYTAKGDVPPGLKNVVSDSAKKETVRKKVAVFSVLAILAVIAGVGAVYIMDIYLKPAKIKRPASSPQPAVIESPKTEVKAQEQQPIAGDMKPETETKPVSRKSSDKKDSEAVKDKAQPSVKTKERSQAVAGKRKKEQVDKSVKQAEMERESITDDSQPKPKNEVKPQQPRKAESKEAAPKDKPAVDAAGRDVYLYTARTYELRRDYQQALLNYKKALEIDPENYVIMNNISSVLIQLSSFEEAVGYAGKVLSIKKDYVPSLVNIGIAHIRIGNLTEGEGYLSKALSREPSNNYALLNLGILHERRGENDKAYGYFSKLSDMGDVQGYLGAGRILEKQGRKADAARIYKDMLSMNNIDPKIKKLVNDRLIQLGQ